MQYTQCKIVGNGSFGVVFQTKLSPSGEDAAIKRVLQDKRFKVREHSGMPPALMSIGIGTVLVMLTTYFRRTANCKSCALSAIRTL